MTDLRFIEREWLAIELRLAAEIDAMRTNGLIDDREAGVRYVAIERIGAITLRHAVAARSPAALAQLLADSEADVRRVWG